MQRTEIDDYLLDEMSESQREKIEDDVFASEELFFEIAERENELVDMYASGRLSGVEHSRFERSLESNPARRQKVENAKVLRELVAGERAEHRTITIAERSGFFAKIGDMLGFGRPAFQFASIGLILIFALAAVFLLIENRRLNSLQTELAAARQRESELAAQVENQRDAADELTADLSVERKRIEELEATIANPGQKAPAQTERPSPTIASLLLVPVGLRGGAVPAQRLEIAKGISRVAISISLPADAEPVEKVSIKLNGETVASNARVRTRSDERRVSVVIAASKFKSGRNEIAVVDHTGAQVAFYGVSMHESQ